MSGEKKPPIIKKIIKKGHGGHHGGSWKVAYADFVTAMMAFFLVMWLLAISSEAGRAALADYYNELTLTDAIFNGGLPAAFTEGGSKGAGIMEGGCFKPITAGDSTVETETDSESESDKGQLAALLKTAQDIMKNLESLPAGEEGGEGSGDMGRGDQVEPLSAEQQQFTQALQSDIQGQLGDAASGQVMMEKVKGGLRIQIVDKEGHPMFSSGGPALTPEAKAILDVVGARLQAIPNKISIEGHTDALRFSNQRMSNWELSTARASAIRMGLNTRGISDDRLTAVTGYASTVPLDAKDPNDPINRRVSIMIWDEEPAKTMAPTPPQPSSASGGQTATQPGAGNRSQVTPPPLPKRPATPRTPPPAIAPNPALGREELEHQLIENTMEKAATPDLSSLGPPLPNQPTE